MSQHDALPWPSDCAAVVPVYNHGATVGRVIRHLRSLGASVLCIDDGSTDHSHSEACAAGARVLRFSTNHGKGSALRQAGTLLRSEGWMQMCSVDADGQHLPTAACYLAVQAQRDPQALWIGARHFPPGTPIASRLGRAACNLAVRLLCRRDPGDVQSGLRVYPLKATPWHTSSDHGYSFEVEMVVHMMRLGVRVRPLGVPVYYPKNRVSHFQPWRDSLRCTWTMLRLLQAASP